MLIQPIRLASLLGLLALTTPFAPLAFSVETVKTHPPGSAGDLMQKGDIDTNNPVGQAGGAIQIKKDCVGRDGKDLKKGQPGYDACLQERLEKGPKAGETGKTKTTH